MFNIKTDVAIKQEPAEAKFETPSSTPKRSSVNAYSKYLPSLSMTMPSFLEDTFQYDSKADESNEKNSNNLIDEAVERSRIFLQDLSKTKAYDKYLDSYDPLPRQYIDLSIRGDETDNDRQYGIKHDIETEKFKIGRSDLQIVGKDFKVNGLTYIGTPGLYELPFKKDPVGYNQSDLDNYMDILNQSNAYRRNFKVDEQIQGSQNPKYRTIIRPYLLKKGVLKSGMQTQPFFKLPPPSRPLRNEIIDRLRLLIVSQIAENDGHYNELVSIVQQLWESKIIK